MKKYTVGELTRTFIELNTFISNWKNYGLNDDDLFEFEIILMQNSKDHPVIQGTGGLRKARFVPERLNKGKSGGFRVIYLDLEDSQIIILLVAKQLVEILKRHYGR
ncbi:hypothetical protein [Sporosarcina sp. FSL K6-3457]|uniref:hypothetical protein n=1 Tax=Sporosarcina sp. FSL K6-3457 TaxID=2978204 RepID=UPI0030F53E77